MFMGEYNHTIDAKGRLIVPSKYREILGEEFILAKEQDGCLAFYPKEEWEAFLAKFQNLPLITNKQARYLTRQLAAGATLCELDKQGRILVPANLRTYAKLDKDIILSGNINKVEIWSKDAWEEISNTDIGELADALSQMGIEL